MPPNLGSPLACAQEWRSPGTQSVFKFFPAIAMAVMAGSEIVVWRTETAQAHTDDASMAGGVVTLSTDVLVHFESRVTVTRDGSRPL
jgi:hypothetical protein